MTDDAPTAPLQPTHPRWLLPLIGTLIVVLVAANNIGNAVWASWVNNRPLALLALNSSNKYLLATSVTTDLVPATVIASLRLLAPDPLFYALGYLYRDRALHWARTAFPGSQGLLHQFEQDETGFKKLLNPLLVILPNNPVCLLAGVAAFPIPRMIVLNVIGTVGRILLFRWIGTLFADQIKDVLDVVSRYQQWFLIGSIVLVVTYVAWQIVGRKGLIGAVEELEEELGDE